MRFCLLLCLAALATPATAQDNPILDRLNGFVTAYNDGDARAVAAFYTEDAALFPPAHPHLSGPEEIEGYYADAFEAGAETLRYTVLEIRGHGTDTAVEIGEAVTTTGDGEVRTRAMHVWRVVDEEWRLSRDMFNVIDPGD
jgi:uncharacterized protein (TIGR02246 family)